MHFSSIVRRRTLGIATALALTSPFVAAAASIAGIEVPPAPPARPVTDTFFGEQVVDPYRFLEEAKAPDVAAWMKQQADATDAILARIPGRAELLAAAVPSVGVMDLLRSELRANGIANIPEYGSVATEAGYRALRAMSTYANIEAGLKYPGLMFVHGVNDIRVPVSESLKAAARFSAATTSGKPVLLRLDYDSGHGQGSSRTQQQERSADLWSFFLWQFGEPAFQPRQPAASSPDPQATRALHALFERSWQRVAERYPEWGTFRGDHRYNDRLDDASPAAMALDDEQQRSELAAARAIDATKLGPTDRVSHALFVDGAERRLALSRFEGHRLQQIDALHGAHSELASLLQAVPMDSTLRAEQLLTRLRAYPAKLDQQIVNLRRGAALGWAPAKPVLERALVQIDGQLPEDLTSGPFYAPFQRLPATMASAERERIQRAARETIATQVIPAMRRLRSFVAGEYLAAAPADGALLHYPDGRAVYDELVRQHTTTRLSAAEVHAIGQRELTRLRGEMEALMRSTGFTGDFAAFVTFLNADPKFFHASPQALLAGYRDIAKRLDAEIPRLFAELPRVPYGIRAMPDHMSPDRAEYYDGPPDDGSRPGWFNANARGYKTRPIWGMATLTAHETVPGHHLQIARAQELKLLPEFRRHADHTAFVEGWALYAETLARELGIFDDPYSLFGHLQAQSMRAARLVVDTGIHSLGWTRQQAIDHMTERTGLNRGFVESEVDRYTSIPGQALAYTIGLLGFAELRKQAERELGARFDVRRFHNALIDNGALPLSTLEQLISEWIERERLR